MAITGAILLVGGILFLPQTVGLFPDGPQMFDTITQDIAQLQNDIVTSTQQTLGPPFDAANTQINDLVESTNDLLATNDAPVDFSSHHKTTLSKPAPVNLVYI